MVKHNNVIPNIHCHKKYSASSRGPLKVKLALDQATKKKSRRIKRAAKAAAIAPMPLEKLRPVVHCPTQRYNAKVRLGRGFSLEEVKAAGLTATYARTIGIAVDHRRRNLSAEGMQANVDRLKEYLSKVVVFPKKKLANPKNGDSGPELTKAATQLTGAIMPIVKAKPEIVMAEITDEMKNATVYTTMRVARKETKVDGFRVSVANRAKKD